MPKAARLIAAFSLLSFVSSQVLANGLEAIVPQCPLWVATAESFWEQCRTSARQFTRTFYPSGGRLGVKEEHSVWFSTDTTSTHFLMGCVLKADRSLEFLGIFYAADPSVAVVANVQPIVGVSFDGDVVLSHDGRAVTLVPVRPFETSVITTRWSAKRAAPLNCQSARGADGGFHLMRNSIFADFSKFDREGTALIGEFPDVQRQAAYIELFPRSSTREVIYSWFTSLLVTTSGSVLVRKDRFPKVCTEGLPERVVKSPLLLHQVCHSAGFARH
jgi:hypothetical protein